jgi:hypothetical protein
MKVKGRGVIGAGEMGRVSSAKRHTPPVRPRGESKRKALYPGGVISESQMSGVSHDSVIMMRCGETRETMSFNSVILL